MAEFQTLTEVSQLTVNGDVRKGAENSIRTGDADLFSQSLISPAVKASLQEVGYTIRPLRRSDYDTGTVLMVHLLLCRLTFLRLFGLPPRLDDRRRAFSRSLQRAIRFHCFT